MNTQRGFPLAKTVASPASPSPGRELCGLPEPGRGWERGSRSVPGKQPAGLCSPAVADEGLLVDCGGLTEG